MTSVSLRERSLYRQKTSLYRGAVMTATCPACASSSQLCVGSTLHRVMFINTLMAVNIKQCVGFISKVVQKKFNHYTGSQSFEYWLSFSIVSIQRKTTTK